MATLTIRLFGYPQFLVNDNPLKITHKKTQALIAYLTDETRSGRLDNLDQEGALWGVCPREELATLLWPVIPPEKASVYLSQAVLDFNKVASAEWILKDKHSIGLNPQMDIRVDVRQFETLRAKWKRGGKEDQDAQSYLIELVNLYQGEFMSGFGMRDLDAFENWKAIRAETLRINLAEVLEDLIQLYSAKEDQVAVTGFAQRWLALDPLNEAAHRVMMRLYAESGLNQAALHQFQSCRKRLLQELGVEPAKETQFLYEHIRSGTYQPGVVRGADARKKEFPIPSTTSGQVKPTGTVTFLFTDIEGSTQLWERQPEEMQHAHARHETIIREAMAAYGGYVYKMVGDGFQVAFSTAPDALEAALSAQRALIAEPWKTDSPLRVRMALHTGVTVEREDDYVGPTLNRIARLLSAGHGGQILLNQVAYDLIRDCLPEDVSLEDLGEHALKDLILPEHIYQLVAEDIPVTFPPLRTADEPPLQLPAQTTPFIGREDELDKMASLLKNPDSRLITLVGVGGTGKTRLAIQAAERCRDFKHGVFFIELASVSTLDGIVSKIAETMKVAFYTAQDSSFSLGEMQSQLIRYLNTRTVLLVLDNFEQLMRYANFITEILNSAQGIKLIVTSRERLNLPGEWVLELGGLPYPDVQEWEKIPDYAAVQLFVRSAERNGLRNIEADDWPAIAHICQCLEGIPLAVEMAAAWVKMMSCQEIEAELRGNLDFLESSWVGIPERHRTLRSVFDYSWNLLSPKECQVFVQLSVFQVGFTREAALQVAAAPLYLLTSLVDKSLVHSIASRRFEIHPVLRQYAVEKLAAQPALRAEAQTRHAQYFSEWLERMYEKLKGSEQLSALNSLRMEARNLVSAFNWLLDQQDYQRLQRAILAMILFYEMDDSRIQMQEIVWILGKMLSILSPLPEGGILRGSTSSPASSYPDLYILTLAALRRFIGRRSYLGWEESVPLLQESLKIAQHLPDSQVKSFALLLDCTGKNIMAPQEISEVGQQCIAYFKMTGDVWATALAQLVVGDNDTFAGIELGMAEFLYQDSLDGFTRLGNDWGRAMCWTGLAEVERRAGRLDQAYRLALQAQEIYELMNNQERLILNQRILGQITEDLGAVEEARRYYMANLTFLTQVGDDVGLREFRNRIAALK